MERMKQRPWLIAIATLIIGVALGFGVSTVTGRSGHVQAASVKSATSSPVATANSNTSHENWDPFAEMERMQTEIDRAIRRATDSFRLAPGADLLRQELGYSSSLDVRDKKDHFEVSAYLPDAEASDVKVATEGDNALRVTVTHQKEAKRDTSGTVSSFSELGQYEQLVTLPEPVRFQDMKVERNGHEVVINIPKAHAT